MKIFSAEWGYECIVLQGKGITFFVKECGVVDTMVNNGDEYRPATLEEKTAIFNYLEERRMDALEMADFVKQMETL